MPYIEDRGGHDFNGLDPWKGYPVAIVEKVLDICEMHLPWRRCRHEIGPETRFLPRIDTGSIASSMLPSLDLCSTEDVEIVLEIEKEFCLTISDKDAQSIETVGQLVQFVKDRL